MYAKKHQSYVLLNFYDMQNDADSTTTLRIGQKSEMVWQATTDSSDRLISNYVNNKVTVYKEYKMCISICKLFKSSAN